MSIEPKKKSSKKEESAEMAELKAKLEIGKARLDRAVAKGAKVTELSLIHI